jgi:hypothetical protein
VAAFVEAKRLKGNERDLTAAVDKYAKMKKSEKSSSNTGGGDCQGRPSELGRVKHGQDALCPLPCVPPVAFGPFYIGLSKAGAEAGRVR